MQPREVLIMGLIRRVDGWLGGDSFFKLCLVPILCATRRVSIGHCLNRRVTCELGILETPGRAWVSEIYVLFTLIIGVAYLVVMTIWEGFRAVPWGIAVRLAPLYFPLDIAFFALRWLFTDRPGLISVRRSLGLFLVNVITVVTFAAGTLMAFDCIRPEDPVSRWILGFTALYSSWRNALTIGPTSTTRDFPSCWECGLLLILENVITLLLLTMIVAALAGLIAEWKKGQEMRDKGKC